MEFCHLYYTLEIEKHLQSIGFTQKQNDGISYWRRDVVYVDFINKQYRFRAYESSPFSNTIDFSLLKTISNNVC